MSILRTSIFIIISSLVLLGGVQSTAAGYYTLEEYFLHWYQVGALVTHDHKNEKFTCESFEVKKSFQCPGCVEEIYRNPPNKKGFGSVGDSGLIIMDYPILRRDKCVYVVDKFANGDELVMIELANIRHSKLLSRNHTASTATRVHFDDIAITNGLYAVYADPKDCAPYIEI